MIVKTSCRVQVAGWRWACAALILLLSSLILRAQTAEETLFFNAAALAFQDSVFERAEKEFGDFVARFPESTRAGEAVLFQGRAALKQQKFNQAVSLLSSNISRAPAFADQYRYWVGEAYMQSSNFVAAADTFAQLIKEHPSSPRLLEASYSEAVARYKLGQFAQTVALLQNPQGTFQRECGSRLNDELVLRGGLLLGEALLEQKSYQQAEQAVNQIQDTTLTPEYKWQKQYLLQRVRIADKRLDLALESSNILLDLAAAAGQPGLLAESRALTAGVLERLSRYDDAIALYTNNLADTAPPEYRRRALLNTIELTLSQDHVAEAGRQMQQFLAKHPDDAASDTVLLTLAELQLKQHIVQTNQVSQTNVTVGMTNLLRAALTSFDRLITNYPQSPLVGRAYLGKGWCYWEDSRFGESQIAFALAVEKLPHSADQAVARFKLADTFFWQKDCSNAVQNYLAVLKDYEELSNSCSALIDQALYQYLRANLELRDLTSASWAMEKILAAQPKSPYGERSQLLVGQSFTRARKPAEARAVFEAFSKSYPESPLRPEVEMAIARSYLQEKAWDSALAAYSAWLEHFPTNGLRPDVEFSRAWTHSLAGRETNALSLFTNFVAEHPLHDLAPYARNWEADFYFRQGNYTNAQIQYQNIFENTNWHNPALASQARMMAGRAAFARQDYQGAETHFTALATNANCPANLIAEAYFALGDTMLMRDADPANPTKKFDEAKEAFRRITVSFPNDRLASAALGRIADCYFQMGSQDPRFYDNAIDYYQAALAPSNHADVTVRSQAEAGWAKVIERQAQLPSKTALEKSELAKTALNHYLNVFEGKLLLKDESLDPFWVKETGFSAAALAETQEQWETANNIYKRLLEKFPVLRPVLEKKSEKAKNNIDTNLHKR
jgi:TolA-binding protein